MVMKYKKIEKRNDVIYGYWDEWFQDEDTKSYVKVERCEIVCADNLLFKKKASRIHQDCNVLYYYEANKTEFPETICYIYKKGKAPKSPKDLKKSE